MYTLYILHICIYCIITHICRERERNDYGSKVWYLVDIKISGKWRAPLNAISIGIDCIAIHAVRTWYEYVSIPEESESF